MKIRQRLSRARTAFFADTPATPTAGAGSKPSMGYVKGAEGDSLEAFSSTAADNPNTFKDESDGARTLVGTCRLMESTDPYLYGLMMTRKIAVTGLKRQFVGGDKPVAEFVEAAINAIPNFNWVLYQMLSAIPAGFSVTEILWAYDEFLKKIVPVDLKPRYQDKFLYDNEFKLKLITADKPDGVDLPEKKFLEFPYMGEYGNKYGQAVYQKIYWYWYFKKHSTKFWAIFTERFASPQIMAQLPANMDPGDYSRVEAFLLNQTSASSLLKPEGVVLELLEAQRSGTVVSYESFMNFLNKGIAIAVLGQTLTSDVQGETGSYAMAKVHDLVRTDILRSDVQFLASVFNDFLIRWMVDYNFPNVREYPQLHFEIDENIDLKAMAEVLQILYLMEVPLAKSYIAKTFNLPEPENEADILLKSPAATFTENLIEAERRAYNAAIIKP